MFNVRLQYYFYIIISASSVKGAVDAPSPIPPSCAGGVCMIRVELKKYKIGKKNERWK